MPTTQSPFTVLSVIARSLCLLLAAALSSTTFASLDNCYLDDASLREQADVLAADAEKAYYNDDIDRYLQLNEKAALLAHPRTIALNCLAGSNPDAPIMMKTKGLAWCKLGIELYPDYRELFSKRFKQSWPTLDPKQQAAVTAQKKRYTAQLCRP